MTISPAVLTLWALKEGELPLVCSLLPSLVLQFQHRHFGFHQRLVKVEIFAHRPLYLIGNNDLNVDPVFGLSWGMIGMMVNTFLLFMVIVIKNEPNGEYTERFIKFGTVITGLGIFVVLLLVSYEIQESKICLYCTTAHIANIAALFGFIRLGKLYDDKSAWKQSFAIDAKLTK